MTVARDYLRAGELTLAQIANRTGYASPKEIAYAASSAEVRWARRSAVNWR